LNRSDATRIIFDSLGIPRRRAAGIPTTLTIQFRKSIDEQGHSEREWPHENKNVATYSSALSGNGAFCFAGAEMGSWKLNESKSKFAPGTGKNKMVVYKDAKGGKVTIVADGVNAEGKPTHVEWTGKFDGKDYAVTGDPNADMRSYTRVDDHTLSFSGKKAGKVTVTGQVSVAADGRAGL
jgi:hypothetical protein